MKQLVILLSCLYIATSANAQVDLSRSPGSSPVSPSGKSNAQLLKESNDQPRLDTVNLVEKYKTDPNDASPVIMRKDAPERINGTTSQEYNLGNTKATNTILYDETGKIKSTGTSIELKKKK